MRISQTVKSQKQQNPFEIVRNREMQQNRVTLVVSTDSGHFVWIIFDPVHLGIVFLVQVRFDPVVTF